LKQSPQSDCETARKLARTRSLGLLNKFGWTPCRRFCHPETQHANCVADLWNPNRIEPDQDTLAAIGGCFSPCAQSTKRDSQRSTGKAPRRIFLAAISGWLLEGFPRNRWNLHPRAVTQQQFVRLGRQRTLPCQGGSALLICIEDVRFLSSKPKALAMVELHWMNEKRATTKEYPAHTDLKQGPRGHCLERSRTQEPPMNWITPRGCGWSSYLSTPHFNGESIKRPKVIRGGAYEAESTWISDPPPNGPTARE